MTMRIQIQERDARRFLRTAVGVELAAPLRKDGANLVGEGVADAPLGLDDSFAAGLLVPGRSYRVTIEPLP